MTTISHFEGLADPADRRTLQPYREQIHAWVYITTSDRRFKARDNSTMALLFLEFPI
ncbi:MAG: hypothetical protein KME22_16225 [Hassallia sp. WJT32-NPBG1]|jgi:hypothetical protein|nr:hypothetical protein [Hassallia sp. WJT32-NPBG1]